MKKFWCIWAAVVLCLSVAGFWVGYAWGQDAGPPAPVQAFNPDLSSLGWTRPTTNMDGTPCDDVDHYVVAVSAADVDLNAGGATLASERVACELPECAHKLSSLMADLPDGEYRFWVRTFDSAGNGGEWAGPFEAKTDRVAPGKAMGFRIIVTVTTTTTTTIEPTTP